MFLIGDVAVKLFARTSPVWFPREAESLRVLGEVPQANLRVPGEVPQAKTPHLLAYGEALSDDDPQHPCIIIERLPGEPYGTHRDELSLEEECALVAQVAEMVRALPETPN